MARLIVAFIFLTLFSSCQQIYFFLTTIATEPVKQQHITVPATTPAVIPNKTVIPKKNDITILLYNGNNIYAYSGPNINNGKKYNYNSISNFLKEMKTTTRNQLRVFIKPGSDVNYKNTVNMLDQMAINDIKNYTLTDQREIESNFIKQLK